MAAGMIIGAVLAFVISMLFDPFDNIV